MKKRIIKILTAVLLLCALALTVTACKGVKMTISFIVDGTEYAAIDTSGNEIVIIPQSPVKDGYTFDGWYWDDGTWQRPFTANSLLNEPLTANMSVYAKFTEIHNHVLTLQPAVKANCEHAGNEAYYTCTCGKLFADVQATVELAAIPAIDKTEHTPTDWIVDGKASCTADGSKHTECSVCHATLQTETIPPNGHTPETEWRTDKTATCTIDGSKHLECSVCHATLQKDSIPATGHTPSKTWLIDSNPTCTINGSKHTECSVCHTTLQTDIITATGHSYSTSWTSDENGHWHVATCEHTNETTKVESHTYDKNFKCKICGYQDTSLHGTEIATEVFDVDGDTLYAKTPNSQTTFSFINAIQVADGAMFVVATDLAASNVIRTKTVSLEIGDNTYYILVENGNDIRLYTVTLRRRPIYAVTFETNGGTTCDSQQVEEDSLATEPATSKAGYTFASWDYSFATPITADTTVAASWTANEYTATYDVNGGVLTDTQYTATYDGTYTLAVPTRLGYTFQGWYVDDTQITDVDGQSLANWTYLENKTVTAKWTINSYTLTIAKPNYDAGTVTGNGTYVYGSEVTVTASAPNLGYDWLGWYDGDTLLSTELTYTFDMPAENLTLTTYKIKAEMSNFNFKSTTATCTITGVKDDTVTKIVIPEYVTSIDHYAFQSCINLTSVTIGNGVTDIGYSAFYGCSNLASINYLGTIESWCKQELYNLMQYGTSSKTLVINGKEITGDLVIPNTVTSIPSFAFRNCTNITSVTFEENSQCTSIGSDAFSGCSSLTSITIHNNITLIGDYTFKDCRNLTSVIIPDSVTIIGIGAFQECRLKSITIPFIGANKGSTNNFGHIFGANSSNENKYYVPSSLSTVIITGISTIASRAFYECANITNITIPNSVTSIEGGGASNTTAAFYGCNSIANINYLGTIESWLRIKGLDNLMGYGTCDKTFSVNGELVTELIIPSTTTSIPSYAFYKCSDITSITFEENSQCTIIGTCAFEFCKRFTNIIIPNSVKTIESNAFYNCYGLENVVIGNGVTSLNGFNFRFSTNLKSVVIGNGVTSIELYDFGNCTNLTSVTIGRSVTSIGGGDYSEVADAFYGCDSLTDINYLGTLASWCKIKGLNYLMRYGSDSKTFSINGKPVTKLVIPNIEASDSHLAFYRFSNIKSVTIPDSITSISSYTFKYCTNFTNVTIGKDVTSIYYDAFSDCNSLETVYYKGTAEDWKNISIDSSNKTLTRATRYYYSETEPALNSDGTAYDGLFWHYNENDEIVIWKK